MAHLCYWLLSNIRVEKSAVLAQQEILRRYPQTVAKSHLTRTLMFLFPAISTKIAFLKGKRTGFYLNIAFKEHKNIASCSLSSISELIPLIPRDICVLSSDSENLVLGIPTDVKVDGNIVLKNLTITKANTWKLEVRGVLVDHKELGLSDTIVLEKENLLVLIELVRNLPLCEGAVGLGDLYNCHSVFKQGQQKDVVWGSSCRGIVSPAHIPKVHMACLRCANFKKMSGKKRKRLCEKDKLQIAQYEESTSHKAHCEEQASHKRKNVGGKKGKCKKSKSVTK